MNDFLPALQITLGLWVASGISAFVVSVALLFFSRITSLLPLFTLLRGVFFVLRATPLLFQLLTFYLISGVLLGNIWISSAIFSCFIAFTINSSSYLFPMFEESLSEYNEKDSLIVCGFNKFQIFLHFEIPYVFSRCQFTIKNEFILLLKSTSLASLVTLTDLSGWAKQRSSDDFDFWTPFIIVAGTYIFLYWTLTWGFWIVRQSRQKILESRNYSQS
jgi:polar amino acid transport system permease protein